MDEVPCLEPSLLALDQRETLALEDEKVFLRRLGVVAAVRLARLQDAQRDPELREERVVATPERAAVPEHVAMAPPGGVARVDDEPCALLVSSDRADSRHSGASHDPARGTPAHHPLRFYPANPHNFVAGP